MASTTFTTGTVITSDWLNDVNNITYNNGVITTNKLVDNAVTTAKITNGAITAEKLNGAQSGSAPIYGARAWVSFQGTGTVTVLGSGNIVGVTDVSTGLYLVTFDVDPSDSNYAVVASCTTMSPVSFVSAIVSTTVSAQIDTYNSSGTRVDNSKIFVAMYR